MNGWDGPGGKKEVYREILTPAQFSDLTAFLERREVKSIGPFGNAAPMLIVDDFEITIGRSSQAQVIPVTGFVPERIGEPALMRLICRGKELARLVSRSGTLPGYCSDPRYQFVMEPSGRK